MIGTGRRRFGALAIILALIAVLYLESTNWKKTKNQAELKESPAGSEHDKTDPQSDQKFTPEESGLPDVEYNENDSGSWDLEYHDAPYKPRQFDYREIFSVSTRDRKYFSIYFGGDKAYNPNIIPHPRKHDMWIVIAQHEQSGEDITVSQQLECIAGFFNGVLVCHEAPTVLPVSPSIDGNCTGDQAWVNLRSGPRDARVFYGPDAPYIIYGSQASHSCLGLWLHDLRMLTDAFRLDRYVLVKLFKQTTELRRPMPWKDIEKNYFLFWDSTGKAYAHYDLWPNRAFAQLDIDGSGGEDLAAATADQDLVCMAKFMPTVRRTQEGIHQATNTLSVTLCKRADPGCVANDQNTFIMHIFHHKTYYDYHGVYEPHVILFRQISPFAVHAISQRPFWIHGRSALTQFTGSVLYQGREELIPEGHSEMFYITSISWKGHGQRYHGYIDDVVFIAFGIEDTRSGGIDVTVGDLLQDLGMC